MTTTVQQLELLLFGVVSDKRSDTIINFNKTLFKWFTLYSIINVSTFKVLYGGRIRKINKISPK